VDVRLTAEDGYQAERSYSIASPPRKSRVTLTVERLDDGKCHPISRRNCAPVTSWNCAAPSGILRLGAVYGGPLLLIAGGRHCALMAMIRHRAAVGSTVPTRLLYSSRSVEDVIYRDELERLSAYHDAGGGADLTACNTRWTAITPHRYRHAARGAWPLDQRPLTLICGPTLSWNCCSESGELDMNQDASRPNASDQQENMMENKLDGNAARHAARDLPF